jgi:hypothetical protein
VPYHLTFFHRTTQAFMVLKASKRPGGDLLRWGVEEARGAITPPGKNGSSAERKIRRAVRTRCRG